MSSDIPRVAMKLSETVILELLAPKPGRCIQHESGRYRMKEADGTDLITTQAGQSCPVEPLAVHIDALMDARKLICDCSKYRLAA
jgi:hypothetical protein